jgi:hypothetical protein
MMSLAKKFYNSLKDKRLGKSYSYNPALAADKLHFCQIIRGSSHRGLQSSTRLGFHPNRKKGYLVASHSKQNIPFPFSLIWRICHSTGHVLSTEVISG